MFDGEDKQWVNLPPSDAVRHKRFLVCRIDDGLEPLTSQNLPIHTILHLDSQNGLGYNVAMFYIIV